MNCSICSKTSSLISNTFKNIISDRLTLLNLARSAYSTSGTGSNEKTAFKSKDNVEQLLEDAVSGGGPGDEVDESDEWRTSPYPVGSALNWKQSQARKSLRPKVDPRDTSIILFPGQGSQFVGMGKKLMKFPMARDIFDAANEILKYNLTKLMLNGPKEELDKTVHSQPAIFVCSLAAIEQLKEERPQAIECCMATAGFSVGELAALTFAGVFTFDAGLKLVKVRAEAMQLAAEAVPGGMATIVYGPDSKYKTALVKAKEWCVERGIDNPECRIANYIGPNTKVIAGNIEALDFVEKNASEFKILRFKRLPVAGAFHTKLMKPAVAPFKEALLKTPMEEPSVYVYSNVSGKRYSTLEKIKNDLPRQICMPVKWEQVIDYAYKRSDDYFPHSYACGAGVASLKVMLRNINSKAAASFSLIEG